MMNNKAFVSIIEMITVVALLIVAFNLLFPAFSYESRWNEALLSLRGRDVIATIDRLDSLYQYSFDSNSLEQFLDKAIPTGATNLIHWSGTEGALKPVVTVACNCTQQQITSLISWIGRLRVNDRDVNLNIVPSSLEPIYSASDALILWWDWDRVPQQKISQYKSNLEQYLKAGKGVVEIKELKGDLDEIQTDIFGIANCASLFGAPSCGFGSDNEDSLLKPDNAKRPIYLPYKYFHHMPISLQATGEEPIRYEDDFKDNKCSDSEKVTSGEFSIRGNSYPFWVCGGKSVYIDTNKNNKADTILDKDPSTVAGDKFAIDGQNLLLSYIDGNARIGITFLQSYLFKDFLKGSTKVYPKDKDVFKIFLSKGNYSNSQFPIPLVILGGAVGKTAWMMDLPNNVDDDHKMLLASLIHYAADKKYIGAFGNFGFGHLTSYVNTKNVDMYEVYKFELGLGLPF